MKKKICYKNKQLQVIYNTHTLSTYRIFCTRLCENRSLLVLSLVVIFANECSQLDGAMRIIIEEDKTRTREIKRKQYTYKNVCQL